MPLTFPLELRYTDVKKIFDEIQDVLSKGTVMKALLKKKIKLCLKRSPVDPDQVYSYLLVDGGLVRECGGGVIEATSLFSSLMEYLKGRKEEVGAVTRFLRNLSHRSFYFSLFLDVFLEKSLSRDGQFKAGDFLNAFIARFYRVMGFYPRVDLDDQSLKKDLNSFFNILRYFNVVSFISAKSGKELKDFSYVRYEDIINVNIIPAEARREKDLLRQVKATLVLMGGYEGYTRNLCEYVAKYISEISPEKVYNCLVKLHSFNPTTIIFSRGRVDGYVRSVHAYVRVISPNDIIIP